MSESTSAAADLTREYGAPFPIISREEGSRYTSLLSRGYTCPRSLDFRLIQTADDTAALDAYCRTLGFQKFVKMNHPAYHHLTLQFYTTLDFVGDGDTFSCRLMEKSVTVTRETLRDIFGFRETGPRHLDPALFWKEISDGRGREFKGSRTPSGHIEDPLLLLMHKYVSHAVFGRSDSSRVSTKDLLYLWCLRRGVLVSTPRFLLDTFKSVVAGKRANMCLGNLITAIAVYFRAFDDPSGMTVLRTRALSLTLIMKTDMKEGKGCCRARGKTEEAALSFKRANNYYKCYKPPTKEEGLSSTAQIDDQSASVKAAISREMETRMNDGFSGLRTCFDALEKKFNDMCARFQALQQDFKQRESNYENLSMRISRIEGDLFVNDVRELGTFVPDSMGKNGSLGKGIVPDVDVEDVAKLFPLTSNSIGSNALSNGERTSPEDHIAKNSPRPQPRTNNECVKPLGTAARDIIEIPDSDDETVLPNRAAQTSKRVLGSDNMNFVLRKRNRTETIGLDFDC